MAKYTVEHSDWGAELYGYQVLKDGKLIDTYEDKDMAEAYVKFMNERALRIPDGPHIASQSVEQIT